tara:strand:- start:168 stop:461 length:294 start_codon:yes stop_codon:yes gene_type:complete
MKFQWIYQVYEFAREGKADQACRYIKRVCSQAFDSASREAGLLLQEYRDRFLCGDIEDQEFCQRVVKICAWYFTCRVWSNKNGPVICIETGYYYKCE